MPFGLDVLRARKGDCLMLHFGSQEKPRLMLIDGGPSQVYGPFLAPRLKAVHVARGLDEDAPLPIEVVMVSHIDDDHIKGILDLTRDQRGTPKTRLRVASLWHNSFDDLLKTKPTEVTAQFGAASFGAGAGDPSRGGDAASILARISGQSMGGEVGPQTKDQAQALQVLASIPQGRQLRDEAEVLQWRPNHKFGGRLILAAAGAKPVTLGEALKITVIGPMQPELEALQEAHDEWLRKRETDKKKEAAAALAAFVDESVPNLSSIVVLAEQDGKKMLLTGDARGDKILEGMELVGLLEKKSGKMHVDILKVPHHGSDNNMETSFFERVTADHYVFSGDGEHGNPERATLEMLIEARGEDGYKVHLTYPVDEIDKGRQEDWEKEQGKEIKRKKKNSAAKVRGDWSAEEHGLAALFDAHPTLKANVEIVGPDTPHVIDLLDPVSFE
jgi:beta-lactamase superfamily II metal-dependent hydrolase